MEKSIEIFATIAFAVVGLSHLLQPGGWVRFFILLREKGEPGAFVDGLLNLQMAGLILAFHNVWSGIPLVLTLLGWCLLLKSLLRMCLPRWGLKQMERVSMERAWEFRIAGAGLAALACLIGYGAFAG